MQIENLQRHVANSKPGLLKFLLMCQVGVMCGIPGTNGRHGSMFTNEANCINVLAAIALLRSSDVSSSHAVYWSYLLMRGRKLGLPCGDLNQTALSSSSALFKELCGIAISNAASCMAKSGPNFREMQCFGEECSADFVKVERHTSGKRSATR